MTANKIIARICIGIMFIACMVSAEQSGDKSALATEEATQVQIGDTGFLKVKRPANYPYFAGFTETNRKIKISRKGVPDYTFEYVYYGEEDEKDAFLEKYPKSAGYTFPLIPVDPSMKSSGLRLNGVWYSCSFIDIKIDGASLKGILAREIKTTQEGMEIIWDTPSADIKAIFTALQDNDFLYLEISLVPKTKVNNIQIQLFSNARSGNNEDKWISTAKRSIQHHSGTDILKKDIESWIFYFDSKSSIAGSGALFCLPEEIDKLIVTQGSTTATDVFCPGNTRKVHFLICNFPDAYKKADEAYQYLTINGKCLTDNLRKYYAGQI